MFRMWLPFPDHKLFATKSGLRDGDSDAASAQSRAVDGFGTLQQTVSHPAGVMVWIVAAAVVNLKRMIKRIKTQVRAAQALNGFGHQPRSERVGQWSGNVPQQVPTGAQPHYGITQVTHLIGQSLRQCESWTK
jgi:hypothetical protein